MNHGPQLDSNARTTGQPTGGTRRTRPAHALWATLAALLAAVLVLGSCSFGGDPEPEPNPVTTTYPYVERPSNLIWESGVFGHDLTVTEAFEDMRGRKLDVLGVSPTRGTWDDTFSDWWLGADTIPADFEGTLNVSVHLFPEDGSLEAAANGEYDEEFARLGTMIAEKYPDAYVRPGWEFNIVNWPWRATNENVETWKEAFRRASIALKQGGPDLRIVWNPNEGKGNSLEDATLAWPGDDVVDIVGLDAYDWNPPYDEKGWETHKTKHQGWDFWGNFTREHGKKFALPEWGVIPGGENSGGDNPAYINYVMQWMVDNYDIMTFETYFEEPDDYCQCAIASMNPNARGAYLEWMDKLTQVPPSERNNAAVGPAATRPGDRPVARVRREAV